MQGLVLQLSIVTTIYELSYEHPVAGNRDFGYTYNADGGYTFYTRGVDRLTSWDAEILRKYANDYPFKQADLLWTSFQQKINEFVTKNEGASSVISVQTLRPDFSKVKAVLNGEAPLSTLSKDCPN